MAWAAAANAVAERAAQGIATRLQLGTAQAFLAAVFLLFLAVVGFRALDWISTGGRFAGEALPLPNRPGLLREWGLGAAIGWGMCLAAALPVLLAGDLHAHFNWRSTPIPAVLLALLTMLAAALAQEVIFRGYPFRRLIAAVGPSWAAVLLSLLFAALMVTANPPHNFLIALVDCTLFGLLLAMAWLRTHALWLGWGLHFAYRAVAALVLGLPIAGHGEFGSPTDMYASGPRWLSGGAFGLDAAALTALVLLGGDGRALSPDSRSGLELHAARDRSGRLRGHRGASCGPCRHGEGRAGSSAAGADSPHARRRACRRSCRLVEVQVDALNTRPKINLQKRRKGSNLLASEVLYDSPCPQIWILHATDPADARCRTVLSAGYLRPCARCLRWARRPRQPISRRTSSRPMSNSPMRDSPSADAAN